MRSQAAEDLAGHYGRHLFVLAYHLCGEAGAAASLAARVIARQAGRRDLQDSDPAAISIGLYRGLLATWRSGGRPSRTDASGPLHRALADLDADARVVTVLRIAEGFDYEEIAVLLEMPAPRVRGALAKARRHLLDTMRHRAVDRRLDAAMTLYLDARLSGPDLSEFEMRLADNSALREAVEFHRGLTLEFREEVPPQPDGFARIVRQECDVLASGVADGGPAWWSRPGVRRGTVLAAAGLVAAGFGVLLVGRPDRGGAGPVPAVKPEVVPVPAGIGDSEPPVVQQGPAPPGRPRSAPPVQSRPVAAVQPSPAVAAQPPPTVAAQQPAAVADQAPPETRPDGPRPAHSTAIEFRVVSVPRPPPIGRDHLVIRTAGEWAATIGADGDVSPPADLVTEMIVLLRQALGADPPTRLVVVRLSLVEDGIEIEARVDPIDPDAGAVAPGQAVIVGASDREVRLVMR